MLLFSLLVLQVENIYYHEDVPYAETVNNENLVIDIFAGIAAFQLHIPNNQLFNRIEQLDDKDEVSNDFNPKCLLSKIVFEEGAEGAKQLSCCDKHDGVQDDICDATEHKLANKDPHNVIALAQLCI